MRKLILILPALALACGDRNPENSAVCGFASLAAGTMVLDHFQAATTLLSAPPSDLQGEVAARVVGRGTARALAARADGGVVLGYEGEGFPARPGFAVVLVDDSSEVTRGVLIFDSDGPADYPQLGTVSGVSSTIPLYGMRIRWSRVSDARCPLFAPARDTAPR